MTESPDYYRATNAAYETLIKCKEFSFPIKIFHIFRQFRNVELCTYSDINTRFNHSKDVLMASSDFGLNIYNSKHNRFIIAYNSDKEEGTVRFTLAHELGHIILGHFSEGEKENKEANCFARNLLCPIPAVDEFNINTPDEYQELFNVSVPTAEISTHYVRSDRYYINEENYLIYNASVFHRVTGFYPPQFYNMVASDSQYYR